ncbi:hypothetical protein KFE25_002160 [Diacronema lutheri]|uniref:Nuclear pore complex protein Nup88 n=1 Tax=Diacronema lutheri TaxID=2081491 RepID=A0A8J6CBC0_DIALT|nr:hypothetical protein KFE25_002160 [Diacronema lutheri]
MADAPLLVGVIDARSALEERMMTLRQRSLLAHTAAGDLILWDAQEQLLCAVAARGGAGARMRAWRPQLVPAALLRAHPSFLAEPAEQQQLLLAALAPSDGALACEGIPFEVYELALSDDGEMAALVGAASVAVVALHLLGEGGVGGGGGGDASEPADVLSCYAVLVGDDAPFATRARAPPARAAAGAHVDDDDDDDAIISASWHPLSSTHLVLLRASGELSMTDVCADVAQPEIALLIRARAAHATATPRARASALALGAGCGVGWASVTAYVALEDGAIFAVCPFVPRSPRARWHVMRLAQEVRARSSARQQRWLRLCARELAAGPPARGAVGGRGMSGDDAEALRARPAVQGPIVVRGSGRGHDDDDDDDNNGCGGAAHDGAARAARTGALLLVPSERPPHLLARARLDGSIELLLTSHAPQGAWEANDGDAARRGQAMDDDDGGGDDDGDGDGDGGGVERAPAPSLELLLLQRVHVAWPRAVIDAFAAPDGGIADANADADERALGAGLGALSLGAPRLQRLRGTRSWIALGADPSEPDRLHARDAYGLHIVHAPWYASFARFVNGEVDDADALARGSALGGGLAAPHERADCDATVPDCPPSVGLTRPLLPSEGALLNAAAARRAAARRASAGRAAAPPDERDDAAGDVAGGAHAAPLAFRVRAAGGQLDVRPQLLGACSSRSPVGVGGAQLFALCANGAVRATDLSAAPPAPPPPRDDGDDGGVGADDAVEAARAGRRTAEHSARLRSLSRAAELSVAALAAAGGVEAPLVRAPAFSEAGLDAFERAVSSVTHAGALPLLELGVHAQTRLRALADGMRADALADVQALLRSTAERALLLEAKARYASAYQANLTSRAAALHAILARTCQPPLTAEEREGSAEVGELLARHRASKRQIALLLQRADEARAAAPAAGPNGTPAVERAARSPPPRLSSAQLEELSGVLAQQESRIAGLMQAVARTEERLRAAHGTLLLDRAERAA